MNKWQAKMDALFGKLENIRKKAEAESRSLTAEEIEERAGIRAEIESTKKEMEDFKAEEELRSSLYGTSTGSQTTETDRPVTAQADQPIYRGSPATMLGAQLLDIRTMSRPEIHERGVVSAARSRLEQVEKRNQVMAEKTADAEYRAAATGGMTVAVPQEGGFFLQGETAVEIMTNGFNNSEILPKTAKRTLAPATQFVEIIGLDETSRATGSRGGGVRIYTNKELGEFTNSKPKFKKIRIEPTKLTGLYAMSGEMVRNVTFMGQEIRQLFGEEYAFKGQDLVLHGTGAGEPLGVLNANCLVTVAKETGQKAATIVTENLSKMWARFRGRNPVWLVNQDCHTQLDQLTLAVGTSALEPRFVTYGSDGLMRIKGAPVVTIEQCETLGTVGDIILGDWSQYITADKGAMNEASSIHVDFIYDQEMFRFLYYFDGQPRWTSALSPYKGTATVSPFVVLATRS